MTKKVSVILPTHARPKRLETAIESILNQTYKNLEVIVIDDNDPKSVAREETSKLMERYLKDERVIYILNERSLGGGPARNEGIKKATGHYITFLDDDDRYLPEKVENQVRFMEENNIEMCFGNIYIHNDEDKLVEYRRNNWAEGLSGEELFKGFVLHSSPTPSIMILREVVERVGAFEDVPMGQEYVFTWKMMEANVNIKYFDGCDTVVYAHNDGRISNGENKMKGQEMIFNLKKTKLHLLNKKEKRFLYFRHYAVLAHTSLRSRNMKDLFKYGMIIAFRYPFNAIRMALDTLNNKKIAREMSGKY